MGKKSKIIVINCMPQSYSTVPYPYQYQYQYPAGPVNPQWSTNAYGNVNGYIVGPSPEQMQQYSVVLSPAQSQGYYSVAQSPAQSQAPSVSASPARQQAPRIPKTPEKPLPLQPTTPVDSSQHDTLPKYNKKRRLSSHRAPADQSYPSSPSKPDHARRLSPSQANQPISTPSTPSHRIPPGFQPYEPDRESSTPSINVESPSDDMSPIDTGDPTETSNSDININITSKDARSVDYYRLQSRTSTRLIHTKTHSDIIEDEVSRRVANPTPAPSQQGSNRGHGTPTPTPRRSPIAISLDTPPVASPRRLARTPSGASARSVEIQPQKITYSYSPKSHPGTPSGSATQPKARALGKIEWYTASDNDDVEVIDQHRSSLLQNTTMRTPEAILPLSNTSSVTPPNSHVSFSNKADRTVRYDPGVPVSNMIDPVTLPETNSPQWRPPPATPYHHANSKVTQSPKYTSNNVGGSSASPRLERNNLNGEWDSEGYHDTQSKQVEHKEDYGIQQETPSKHTGTPRSTGNGNNRYGFSNQYRPIGKEDSEVQKDNDRSSPKQHHSGNYLPVPPTGYNSPYSIGSNSSLPSSPEPQTPRSVCSHVSVSVSNSNSRKVLNRGRSSCSCQCRCEMDEEIEMERLRSQRRCQSACGRRRASASSVCQGDEEYLEAEDEDGEQRSVVYIRSPAASGRRSKSSKMATIEVRCSN